MTTRPRAVLALCLAACSENTTPPHAPKSVDGSPESGTVRTDGGSGRDARGEADSAADGGHRKADAGGDGPTRVADASTSEAGSVDAEAEAGTCTTKISYGANWIAPAGHSANFDVAAGVVTWDGVCTDDGANRYAVLSNGWRPYFAGDGPCVMALDPSPHCGAEPTCTTRVTYGPGWLAPADHPTDDDVVAGRVFTDGTCHDDSGDSYVTLSNGWEPHFTGAASCRLSLTYSSCGGLYTNPVIPTDCPDPGVLAATDGYVLTCTSGDDADAYPIYTSPDLVSWQSVGHVFPAGHWPTWAVSDFWAPEIHAVGGHYVAYFSARDASGVLRIGAASAMSPLGPFTDVGHPLIEDGSMGLIDASEVTDTAGTPYVLWKEDGNAVGKPTPIHAQALAPDGLSLAAGSPATLITNDQPWEGAVTEAPFMVLHNGTYFLFYSGNSYANASYAVGVASGPSPLGPFTKATAPILVTSDDWVGPGHCAVTGTPSGDVYLTYHAWPSDCVDGPGCGRFVLTDALEWTDQGPSVPFGPSSTPRPLP